jgi:hypothetical protein
MNTQGNDPFNKASARTYPEGVSDEVTDGIAHIEMHRQEAVKDSGLAVACSEALRKLQELLEEQRTVALQTDPQGRSPDVEAVMLEIRKVKGLAGNGGDKQNKQNHARRNARPAQPQGGGRPGGRGNGGPHGPPRNKGRRTVGRGNGH